MRAARDSRVSCYVTWATRGAWAFLFLPLVVPSSMPSKKGIAKAVLVGFMVRNENRNMPDAGMPG